MQHQQETIKKVVEKTEGREMKGERTEERTLEEDVKTRSASADRGEQSIWEAKRVVIDRVEKQINREWERASRPASRTRRVMLGALSRQEIFIIRRDLSFQPVVEAQTSTYASAKRVFPPLSLSVTVRLT